MVNPSREEWGKIIECVCGSRVGVPDPHVEKELKKERQQQESEKKRFEKERRLEEDRRLYHESLQERKRQKLEGKVDRDRQKRQELVDHEDKKYVCNVCSMTYSMQDISARMAILVSGNKVYCQEHVPREKVIIRTVLGYVGTGLLLIGVFSPLISVPIRGNLNYFQNGKGDGMIVIGLAIIAMVLIVARLFKFLLIPATLSLVMLAITFRNLQIKLAEMRIDIEGKLGGTGWEKLGDSMINSAQMEMGWIILILGAILLFAAAFVKEEIIKSRSDGMLNPS